MQLLRNLREFRGLAKDFAADILRQKNRKAGIVIGLIGQLGAGKTTFIKSFLRSLGVRSKVTSPTFIIMRTYKMPRAASSDFRNVFHIDAYRLSDEKEILDLGFRKIVSSPNNIALIEWADKIKKIMPKNTIWINIEFGKTEKERLVKIVK